MTGPARLWRKPLDLSLDPASALLAIHARAGAFALTGSWAGGGAILGSDPLELAGRNEDPFETWDRVPELTGAVPAGAVGGGWFGWLGYGAGRRIETLPPQPPRPDPLPEFRLAYHDNVLRLDRAGRWWFEALVTPEREKALHDRCAHLEALLADTADPARPPAPEGPESFRLAGPGARGHLASVARCRERIRSGEFFQANLRVRLEARWAGNLAALFAAASDRTRPAYGAFFTDGHGGIASLSPELFLRRSGRRVETAPIKGTASRSGEPARDEASRKALAESAKDAAEHVMIVDVARNDLGRVCEEGTIAAPSEPEAQAHPGVWHLVSSVEGRLRPEAGDAELLRATFPPCSVTGAPKIQAMHAIAGLEPFGREVFTGAIGFASPAAGLELSVAIRTFEANGDRLWLDVGGGIVADSDPERELEECLVKARPLVEAVGSRIEAPDRPEPVRHPSSPGHGPGGSLAAIEWALNRERLRPDPKAGVIETLAVKAGRPENPGRHLARMSASVARLYGTELPGDLEGRVREEAVRQETGALRITASPDGSTKIEARPVVVRDLPVDLTPFILPGGLGCHKWADRRLLDSLSGDGTTPLLIDTDGTVLEAAWGNVWIEAEGSLITPPPDGRILPGVTRQLVIESGAWKGVPVREERICFDRLITAERILVSSSLAGLIPATV